MAPRFVDTPPRIVSPSFDSPLTDVVMELENLRRLRLSGDTPSAIFYQLKDIFHMLESLGSARIEGNHTTLADYIESKIESSTPPTDQLQEVLNIEYAMGYVEKSIKAGVRIGELHPRTTPHDCYQSGPRGRPHSRTVSRSERTDFWRGTLTARCVNGADVDA
jgi:Fic family protein